MIVSGHTALTHLLSQPIDPRGGGQQYTIAQWLMVAAKSHGAPKQLLSDNQTLDDEERTRRATKANEMLAPMLLCIIEGHVGPHLFVGNAKAQPILNLFHDSEWAGGAWSQDLLRIPGARLSKHLRRMAGLVTRGVEIPWATVFEGAAA